MQTYSGFEYLLIDVANQFGLDKLLFEERIQWAREHLDALETLSDRAEVKPLYLKAVQAVRKAQKGIPTGHLVGLDACCSGIQVMSAITGCIAGATATGLVDPNVRADAYSSVTQEMNDVLHQHGIVIDIPRKQAKEALMTTMYGSKAKPIEIFGENTPELNAFYEATYKVAPGAWELLQDLLASWQSFASFHSWKLPDGYDAKVKVMTSKETRIEVDELDHATFTYEYYENIGQKKGISLPANVVHSIDAYVLRTMYRRCNYDVVEVSTAYEALLSELDIRNQNMGGQALTSSKEDKLNYYIQQYDRTNMADIVILPYIVDGYQTMYMSTEHIEKLIRIIESMEHKPFELVTVHDEFKAHPNNLNHVRQHYINIFAELSESNIIEDIISQILQIKITYNKLSTNLGNLIRTSNYALS